MRQLHDEIGHSGAGAAVLPDEPGRQLHRLACARALPYPTLPSSCRVQFNKCCSRLCFSYHCNKVVTRFEKHGHEVVQERDPPRAQVDMAGSAVWYHVVSGRKVFLLAPPTAANLAAYEAWAGSERQARPHRRQLLGLFTSFMRRTQPRCKAGFAAEYFVSLEGIPLYEKNESGPECGSARSATRSSHRAQRELARFSLYWQLGSLFQQNHRILVKGNLLFANRCRSQAEEGFAERAAGCVRAELAAGDTLLLPASWPHAVATPEDTLALGGNFLHGLDLRCDPYPIGHGLWAVPGRQAARLGSTDLGYQCAKELSSA